MTAASSASAGRERWSADAAALPPETDASAADASEADVRLTNDVGLHARPSVKFTKLAKSFAARISVRTAESAWVDAKSIVKVMALKARSGAILRLRAEGEDAAAAVAALVALIRRDFADA